MELFFWQDSSKQKTAKNAQIMLGRSIRIQSDPEYFNLDGPV